MDRDPASAMFVIYRRDPGELRPVGVTSLTEIGRDLDGVPGS
jgi:hypothetical protein